MATMLRNEFADLFFSRLAYLDMIFFEEYGEPDGMIGQIWNVRDSNSMREQTTGITGFNLAVERPENEPITYDKLMQAFDKTFTHTEYGLGYQVSKRVRRDDLDGIFSDATRALARSMRTTKFQVVWNVFNNGFTTETTPDGVSLFNTAHPLVEGGTFSNRQNADFSITALETAIDTFNDMRDHRNLPIELEPQWLLYHFSLQWLVREIIRSPEKPDTANRSINPVAGILQTMANRYLTGTDDWFITSAPGNHALMLWNNQELETDQDMDFDTDAAKYKSTQIHSQGAADWRGTYGGLGQ